jgi:hypothetical protein
MLSSYPRFPIGPATNSQYRMDLSINQPSRNEGVKFVRGLRAASVLQALIIPAKLSGLGCINSPKANARPVNFECVAVNDAGLTGQIVRERWRSTKACRSEEQPSEHVTSDDSHSLRVHVISERL